MKFFILLFFLITPFTLQAEDGIPYTTLAPIQTDRTTYVDRTEVIYEGSLSTYLNNMFKLGIALCTGLAVLMIIIGGIQYVSSDAWSSKTDGKERIFAALLGLVIAFGSYALLNTINPDLLGTELTLQKLKIENIEPITKQGTVPTYGQTNGSATTGQVTSNGLQAWGDPSAIGMVDQNIKGRQVYYAPGENISDSNTDKGLGAFGNLVEGTPTTVGSAASVYYPAGTLVEVGGIKYVIDDNNLVRQRDGSLVPANNVLTNNYTIDIFTRDKNKANTQDSKNDMKVLYVPINKVSGSDIQDIRNNPSKYAN